MAAGLIGLGVVLSAVQWIPSKELLDRSPRAGGLTYEELTYASWSPELLPTLVVHEAYGTRARDTDWMDGFYPYHEMDAYLGLVGLSLAALGAGGPGRRDRWTRFWVLLAGVGGVLMLGKFTFLFDLAHKIPVLGSSREPVRFHLWVSLAVAALAAVGVERLARPGPCGSAGPSSSSPRWSSPRSRSCCTCMLRSGPSPGGGRSRTTWTAIAGLAGSCRWRPPATPSWSSSGLPRPPGPPGLGFRLAGANRLGVSDPGPGGSRGRALSGCPHRRSGVLDVSPGDGTPAQGRPELHPRLRRRRQAFGRAGLRLRADRLPAPLATLWTGACPRPGAWQPRRGRRR